MARMPAPENSLLVRIASNLRLLRKKRHMTREDLAESTDVDPQIIKRIESGKANPTLVTLSRLASAFAMSLAAVLAGDLAGEPTLPEQAAESEAFEADVVGETLESLRRQRHVSRRGLARLVDIRTGTLQRYESGHTDPRVLAIESIARALSTDSVEIVRAIERRQRHVEHASGDWRDHSDGVQMRLVSATGRAELWECRLDAEAVLSEPPALATVDEIATAIRGTIVFELDDERHVLRRGGSIAVPAQRARRFVNAGKSPARLLRFLVRN